MRSGFSRDVGDEALEIFRREIRLADDRHRHVGDQADRLKAFDRIVGQGLVEADAGRLADVTEQDRVAVRFRLGDAGRADRSAGAADIHDDDLLSQAAPHRFGDQAGDDVARPGGGERHHHRHRAVRIILRERRYGAAQEQESGCDPLPKLHDGVSSPSDSDGGPQAGAR